MSRPSGAFRNTLTNYLLVFVRLLEGVLLTRWLLHSLGKEYYGFWALLWSVFVYALLLDFGFGKAAQKYTARRLFDDDADEYNRILAAIFGMHAAVALLIVGGALLGGIYLPFLTDVSDPAELAYCRKALLLFGIGTALTFPLGMFNEVLVGLHKIYLRNYIQLGTRCAELAGVGILLFCGGGLLSLVIFSVTLNFCAGLVTFFTVRREIPAYRPRLRIDLSVLRKLADFSFFIYLVSIANLLVNKTDRLILSIFTGLGEVGVYQVGSRIPEIVQIGTTQYQETLSPVAASLHGREKLPELRRVVFNALRYTSLLATPLVCFIWLLTPQALRLLFAVRDDQAAEVCRLMLVSVWIFVVFRSVPIRILMMSGAHRFLAATQISEAVLKLTLCLWLVRSHGITGVVYGGLISNAVLALLVMVPYLCGFLQKGIVIFLFRIYIIPILFTVIPAVLLIAGKRYFPDVAEWLPAAVAAGAAMVILYASVALRWGLTSDERRELNDKLQRIVSWK